MGALSQRKGRRVEQQLVRALRAAGLDARRVPLSGAVRGFEGDVLIGDQRCEIKARRSGFRALYRCLAGARWLFLRADRQPYLVIGRLEDWLHLAHSSGNAPLAGQRK